MTSYISKLQFLILILVIFSLSNCKEDEDNSANQDSERKSLNMDLDVIRDLAFGFNCTDSSEWSYISYGAKACGGPVGYYPYYLNTDTSRLFTLLDEYKSKEKIYNEKWGIVSDCSIPQEPEGVYCEAGVPMLYY